MKYQAKIKVGLFGRFVYFKPRKWKWMAEQDAKWYCFFESRHTEYEIISIKSKNKYLYGPYLLHSDGYLQPL